MVPIRTRAAGRPAGWIRQFHPVPDAATRLVCLPHAGGSAGSFFPLSAAAPASIEVLCVQYPGRQDRLGERCLDQVEQLADCVLDALDPWLDRPVALFGHSLGAAVGFELAHRLEAEGVLPRRFFASSARAPSRWRQDDIHLLPDAELISEVLLMGGTGRDVSGARDLLRLALPAIRADFRAAETYQPRPLPALCSPISVLVGDDDPRVTADEARAWQRHTAGRCSFHHFPGGHFYLQDQLPSVLDLLAGELGSQRAARQAVTARSAGRSAR